MQTSSFNERARNWDSDPKKVERAWTVATEIKKQVHLEHAMTALEYGCGTGLLSFALKDEFSSITLADTSEGMLDVLAEKIALQDIQNMFPKKLDLVNDPLPIQKFNILYSLMTLHHIPEVENILQKFFDVLLPDGWIAISDLDAEDGSFHGVEQQHVHKGFERNALQKQVETAGFVDVHFFTVFHMTKTVGDGIRNFPIFLMIARKPNIHL